MKTPSIRTLLSCTLAALVGGLFFSASAQANIVGINSSAGSIATIGFFDSASSAPPNGSVYGNSVAPWGGSIVTLPLTTDPNTGDSAGGSLEGTFMPGSGTYAINFNSITLNQLPTNTGNADLSFFFTIDYQLDAAGLALQPTLYPNFVVTGTVSTAGSFALIQGSIDYFGTVSGIFGLVETVDYNSIWNTPGPFIATAFGVPVNVNKSTPALDPNTTLRLQGFINFRVDPASINAFSVQIPEPSRALLSLLGLCGVLVRRR